MRTFSANAIVLSLALLCLLPAPVPAHAQCADWQPGPFDDGTAPNGADGSIYASVSWDPDGSGGGPAYLVVGGEFTHIGGVAAKNIAMLDPTSMQWQPMGSGINTAVGALVVFDGEVVAGCAGDNDVGTFDQTVRHWNGSSWQNLSATNRGNVTALGVWNGVLYIGGTFMTQFVTQTSNPAHYVARWNPGVGLWEDVEEAGFGTQTNGGVYAFEAHNGDLYVGGFSRSTSSPTGVALRIARGYSPTGWVSITNGTDPGGVYDFTVYLGELIAVGGFNTVNGAACSNIAGWDGSSFHPFHLGTSGTSGIGTIWSAAYYGGLVIAGHFTTASGQTTNYVALWPDGGSSWQPMGLGMTGPVWDLIAYNQNVFVYGQATSRLLAMGDFTQAGLLPANHIAQWDGVQWGMMAGGGAANNLLAMAEFQGKLVAGGDFHQSTAHLPVAHHIVAWDGLKLTAFGSGMDGPVNALKTVSSTELVAGGTFTRAGGRTVSNIARWAPDPRDPLVTRWQPMGSGFNSGVFALERYNNITHAGGGFTTSGSTVVNSVARFNEGTGSWLALGGGMNGTVYALKEYNGALYAGGTFTTAGGIATGGLARWNGVSWNQVGGYFQGFVFALEVHDDKLVIGGQYPGINSSPNLARYDGLGYSTFATGGTNSTVRALRSVAGRLYIGGYFTAAGTVAASRVAYWDGSWHDASGGADNYVFALGGYHDEVQVGGMFQSVDQGSLSSPTWARYVDSGLPWFASQPVSRTIMLGDDVSFTAQAASGFPGLSYRWHHNGAPLFDGPTGGGSSISGATTQTVSVSDAVWTDHGTYQLVASNPCGSVSSNPATLEFTGTTGVSPETGRITAFESLGPNPSGGSSQLAYSLASDASVRIRVHDVRGRLVRRWEAGHLPAGRHRAIWDAKDDAGARVAAGAYFVGLEVDGHTVGTRRLTILR